MDIYSWICVMFSLFNPPPAPPPLSLSLLFSSLSFSSLTPHSLFRLYFSLLVSSYLFSPHSISPSFSSLALHSLFFISLSSSTNSLSLSSPLYLPISFSLSLDLDSKRGLPFGVIVNFVSNTSKQNSSLKKDVFCVRTVRRDLEKCLKYSSLAVNYSSRNLFASEHSGFRDSQHYLRVLLFEPEGNEG